MGDMYQEKTKRDGDNDADGSEDIRILFVICAHVCASFGRLHIAFFASRVGIRDGVMGNFKLHFLFFVFF